MNCTSIREARIFLNCETLRFSSTDPVQSRGRGGGYEQNRSPLINQANVVFLVTFHKFLTVR